MKPDALRLVPEKYDRCMVPFAFAPFARALVGMVRDSPSHVLDLASGTGIVASELHARFPQATVIAADTSASMLGLQLASSNTGGFANPARADAAHLPFRAHVFDLVTCGFGAMFFSDKVSVFSEVRRVLRPGGLFLSTTWAPISENPLIECIEDVARQFVPNPNDPLFAVPFSYWDAGQITQDLCDAGFNEVCLENLNVPSGACKAEDVVTGFLEGNPIVKRFLDPPDLLPRLHAAAVAQVTERFGQQVQVELRGMISMAYCP